MDGEVDSSSIALFRTSWSGPKVDFWDGASWSIQKRVGQTFLSVPYISVDLVLPGPRVKSNSAIQAVYCLSETTTLWTACPSASLPLKVEVRVFPSLETVEVTVIVTWPPFFIVDSIVLASIRFTETVSA